MHGITVKIIFIPYSTLSGRDTDHIRSYRVRTELTFS